MRGWIVAALAWACLSPAHADVEGGLVGTWETRIQNPQGTWDLSWEIRADGRYVSNATGPMALPPEEGTVEASAGRWTLKAATGRADGGTYRLEGDSLTMTGLAGTAVWKRRTGGGKPPPDPSPVPAAGGRPVADTGHVAAGEDGHSLVPVRGVNWSSVAPGELAPAAREAARVWQADARLAQVLARSGPDGRVNVAAMQGLVYNFLSPSTGYGLAVIPSAKGQQFVCYHSPGPLGIVAQEIPARSLDLDEALAKARAAGLNSASYDAALQVTPAIGSRPARCVWLITATGQLAGVGVDAASGQVLPLEEASGQAEVARLVAEKLKGRPFPAGHPTTLAWYREQADKLAKEIHPGFQLYGIDIEGAQSGAAISYAGVRFRFLVLSGWNSYSTLTLYADAGMIRGDGMGSVNTLNPPALPLPANILAEQAAFAKMVAMSPIMCHSPDDSVLWANHRSMPAGLTMHLQLVSAGFSKTDLPTFVMESMTGGETVYPKDHFKGRWAWRLIGVGSISFGTYGVHGGNTEAIWIDAVTGERLQ